LLVLLLLSARPFAAEPSPIVALSTTDQKDIANTTADVVRRFGEWFDVITQVEIDTGAVAPRWWTNSQDASLERAVTIAVARRFWSSVTRGDPAFAEGLARYSAARVINEAFEGSQVTTYRFFGGFIPHAVRAVPLSRGRRDPRPVIRRFPEFVNDARSASSSWVPTRDDADRWADTFHTLERFIGWPATQQVLNEFARRSAGSAGTPTALAQILREQRGSPVEWFDEIVGRRPRDVDFVVESFTASATTSEPAMNDVLIRARREGDALFSVPVLTQFADGTQVRERFEPGQDRLELRYRSRSAALRVAIDPDAVLLLDTDRINNVRTFERRFSAAAAQLTWSWLIWLQDVLLTCAALT
jgi:hypothetical protein